MQTEQSVADLMPTFATFYLKGSGTANARDTPIIPKNLPITLLRISPKPSQLFTKTKPIILHNNFTLGLAEKFFCWVNR